jgi:hypothetical protein
VDREGGEEGEEDPGHQDEDADSRRSWPSDTEESASISSSSDTRHRKRWATATGDRRQDGR